MIYIMQIHNIYIYVEYTHVSMNTDMRMYIHLFNLVQSPWEG